MDGERSRSCLARPRASTRRGGSPLASTHVGGDVIATRAADLHDMLTGSSPDGRAVNDGKDSTCGDWTKSGEG